MRTQGRESAAETDAATAGPMARMESVAQTESVPLAAPVHPRRSVRLSMDIEDIILENLPGSVPDKGGRHSQCSRSSVGARSSVGGHPRRGSRTSIASLGSIFERVSYDGAGSPACALVNSYHPSWRSSASSFSHDRSWTSGLSRVSIRSGCLSNVTDQSSFASQSHHPALHRASMSTPLARPKTFSRLTRLVFSDDDEMRSREESSGVISLIKAVTHTPGVQRCRHRLLPWLMWLPAEMAVLLLFVTPPFVVYVYNTLTHRYILLGGSKAWTKTVIPICSWGHFSYLALRVFASGCSAPEFAVFFVWVWWMWMWSIRKTTDARLHKGICVVLCAAMVILYLYRLLLLGQELRRISRQLVSKKKRRFVDVRRGFDLDLSYISKRLIAMGFPSQNNLEGQFRNSMEEVQRFFSTRHKGHYKVYNLCIERTYTHRCFEEEFHEVRFPDHNPCPLARLREICEDMKKFQAASGSNVVAVHCKAGKGRTGLVIAAFLLHTEKCRNAKEALEVFGKRRTFNGKGVTIPSQIRYVHHYEQVVREGKIHEKWVRLRRVEATRWPWEKEDCIIQIVTHEEGLIFNSNSGSKFKMRPSNPPLLEGDVKFIVFQNTNKLFHFWLHTGYDVGDVSAMTPDATGTIVWESTESTVSGPAWTYRLQRKELDGIHKEKEKENFEFSVIFEKPPWPQVNEEMTNRQRRRAQREVDSERRHTLALRGSHYSRSSCGGGDTQSQVFRHNRGSAASSEAEDYDEMGNDTDEEEMLSTLCRGYLERSRGCCAPRARRWCEISTSGQLHIAGKQLLVVNVAEGRDKVCRPASGVECGWNVRNPTTGTWELLVANESDELKWDQAFSDCLRLGAATSDANTAFCGFFWKLNHDAEQEKIQKAFDFESWRIRLFVLRDDGQVLLYSRKDKDERVFVDFATPLVEIHKLPFCWRNMPHTVPFQIRVAGERPKILAAREEEFQSFAAKVGRLRADFGLPVQHHGTFVGSETSPAVLTQW